MFWPIIIGVGAIDAVLVGWLGWIAAGAATSGNANYPPEHYSRLQ